MEYEKQDMEGGERVWRMRARIVRWNRDGMDGETGHVGEDVGQRVRPKHGWDERAPRMGNRTWMMERGNG